MKTITTKIAVQQEQETMTPRPSRSLEEGLKMHYEGIFKISVATEEVVFILRNLPIGPNIVRTESKVTVPIKAAKRIAVILSNLIQRYETKNGVIDISTLQQAPEKSQKAQRADQWVMDKGSGMRISSTGWEECYSKVGRVFPVGETA